MFQINYLIKYKLLNCFFKNKGKLTGADHITIYVEKNKKQLFKQLIKKYPDLLWIEKYLYIKNPSFVVPLTNMAIHKMSGLTTLWTKYGTFDDGLFLLKNGIQFISQLFIKNSIPHSQLILNYNEKTKKIIVDDPLGDFNINYKLCYGYHIEIHLEKFIESNVGNPIFISTHFPKEKAIMIKQHFEQKEYYILE